MARIPLPEARVGLQPSPMTRTSAAAFGSQVGDTAVAVGAQMMREEQRVQAEQDRIARETRIAADKARAFTVVTGAEDGLADLHDAISNGVRDGSVPKDKAEEQFRAEASKLLDKAGQDLPPTPDRELVVAQLQRKSERLTNGVRQAVVARDRHDVSASITQSLEFLQRQYAADPQGATAKAMATIEQLGPFSNMTPEQLASLGQRWKEGTQFTAGYEAVSAARNDRKGLDAAERLIGTLPDLDSQKRATLVDRIGTYRMALDQKAEHAAQRAAREEERRLRHAEASFNSFQAMADKGTALDPAYIDQVLAQTQGTPYQAGVRALAKQARETGGMAAQPLQVQRATLQAIDAEIAKSGRSPALDKRRDQIEKVLRGSEGDAERDALRAGLERGVITDLPPLSFQGGIQGLTQQLGERVVAAQRVSMWAGKPVSPLTDDEAATFKRQIDQLPAKERSTAIAALAQVIDPSSAQGLAQQLDKKDRSLALAFAYAGDKTTAGRFTSELILKGKQAQAEGTSTKGEKSPDVKASSWRAFAAAELDNVFPNAQTAAQVRDAAELVMHGIAAEQGGSLSKADMERAVRLAVGGSLYELNGRKIPLPAGVDGSMLEKRLASITPEDLAKQAPSGKVRAGGAEVQLSDFVKSLPGQQLMPVRPGQYAVLVNGRPVTNDRGAPVIVGVR